MNIRSTHFFSGLLLAVGVAWAALSGVVTTRSGLPLPGVEVRQFPTSVVDTTDLAGAWSFQTTTITTSPVGKAARIEGKDLVVSLENASLVEVSKVLPDGRQKFLLKSNLGRGVHRLSLSGLGTGASCLRVRTGEGIVTLNASFAKSSSIASVSSAARSSGASDSLVFSKPGFFEVRRAVVPGKDTFVVVMDSLPVSPPVMTLLNPNGVTGTVVPFDSSSITVRWKILDPAGVVDSLVKINGTVATKENDSVYRLNVTLKPTGEATIITTVAANTKGMKDTVVILATCQKDQVAPSAILLANVQKNVPFDTLSQMVGWTVTDNDRLASVAINGTPISGVSGVYATRIALSVGTNIVRLVALDSTGNLRKDSVVLVRALDQVLPNIVRSSIPASPMIYAKTATVSFSVTDNDQVVSVTINGAIATKTGNVYSRTLALEPDLNSVLVVATDPSGNKAKDSLVLKTYLKDRDGNALSFGRMPDGKIWTRQNLSALPSATSVDANINATSCARDTCEKYGRTYSWAMLMDVPATCDTASCPLSDSLAHQGLCPVGWHIPTAANWDALIRASASGLSDSVGMSRLMSTPAEGKWFSYTRVSCGTPSYTEINYSGTDNFGFQLMPALVGGGGGGCGGSGNTYAPYFSPTQVDKHNAAVWNGGHFDGTFSSQDKTLPSLSRCVMN